MTALVTDGDGFMMTGGPHMTEYQPGQIAARFNRAIAEAIPLLHDRLIVELFGTPEQKRRFEAMLARRRDEATR